MVNKWWSFINRYLSREHKFIFAKRFRVAYRQLWDFFSWAYYFNSRNTGTYNLLKFVYRSIYYIGFWSIFCSSLIFLKFCMTSVLFIFLIDKSGKNLNKLITHCYMHVLYMTITTLVVNKLKVTFTIKKLKQVSLFRR